MFKFEHKCSDTERKDYLCTFQWLNLAQSMRTMIATITRQQE